jgi:nucleotide-binding universal stress UspA family protein
VYRNIVIAYDGSDGAKAALARAAKLAARDDAALTMVESVGEKLPALVPGAPPMARHPEEAAAARHELKRAVETLDPSLEASPWVVGGPAAKAVLIVADDIEADLIVTGSRAQGRIARTVLGSVSTEILHGARCDVLVVHPPDD